MTAPLGDFGLDAFCVQFVDQANHLATRYGAPIFLVGSALTSLTPFDVDIRVMLTEADVLRLYGEAGPRTMEARWNMRSWRLAYDALKQSRRLSRACRCTIDFGIQVGEDERYAGRPRRRLDQAPDWFWRAGDGDA